MTDDKVSGSLAQERADDVDTAFEIDNINTINCCSHQPVSRGYLGHVAAW